MTMIQNLIKNHMLDKLLSILRQVRDGRSADPFLLVLIIHETSLMIYCCSNDSIDNDYGIIWDLSRDNIVTWRACLMKRQLICRLLSVILCFYISDETAGPDSGPCPI